MNARVVKEVRFEAAHRLPHVPKNHKCFRLHGHSFRAELHAEGHVDAHTGWVLDFDALGQAFQPLFDQLDHHTLNDVEGLENPTSEHLAHWIWQRLKPTVPQLCRVVIHETCDSRCIYEG